MTKNFTVAILADIHGNMRALKAVLDDINRHLPDVVVFAGDLVMNGPHPAQVLALIRELGHPAVVGNTDIEVSANTDPVARWTYEKLSAEDVAYLRALPLTCRLRPPHGGSPDDDLIIVHATPRSPFDNLILEPHPLQTTFTQATPEDEAKAMLNGEQSDLIVYGHIHYKSSGCIGSQKVMSLGAVGFPFDGDRRAAYGLATWNGKSWQLEQCRVAYDSDAVAKEVERSSLPFPNRYATILREANWFPRP